MSAGCNTNAGCNQRRLERIVSTLQPNRAPQTVEKPAMSLFASAMEAVIAGGKAAIARLLDQVDPPEPTKAPTPKRVPTPEKVPKPSDVLKPSEVSKTNTASTQDGEQVRQHFLVLLIMLEYHLESWKDGDACKD